MMLSFNHQWQTHCLVIIKMMIFNLLLFLIFFFYIISILFSVFPLQILNKLAISTLLLSILPSEVMLGCTQEEIGGAGWCAVCINNWYLPAFDLLFAPSCHCQTTIVFKQFISRISVVDDVGYVVYVHESCLILTSVCCNLFTETSTTFSVFSVL